MKFKRPGIHNYFYVFAFIQGIAGGLAMFVGIIMAACGEDFWGPIVAVIGLAAMLITPFISSWGVVVENICCINDHTALLAKKANQAKPENKEITKEDLPEI